MKIVLLRPSRVFQNNVVIGFDAPMMAMVQWLSRQSAVPITSVMTVQPNAEDAKSGIVIHKDWFPCLFRTKLKRITC